jgi:hypothetical protein
MGWERGRYYARSRRVDGRVTRVHIGRGPAAEAAAVEDRARRDQRVALRRRLMDEQAEDRMMRAPQLSLSSPMKRAQRGTRMR